MSTHNHHGDTSGKYLLCVEERLRYLPSYEMITGTINMHIQYIYDVEHTKIKKFLTKSDQATALPAGAGLSAGLHVSEKKSTEWIKNGPQKYSFSP